jgi:hypothetical protein
LRFSPDGSSEFLALLMSARVSKVAVGISIDNGIVIGLLHNLHRSASH